MLTVKTLLLVAAGIGIAFAACPNGCSGHGRCNEIDRCVCFKSTGTKAGLRESWTGPDCSLRVCPYGRAFDVLSTAEQDVVGSVGALYVSSNRKDSSGTTVAAPSSPPLKAALASSLKVKFDVNIDFEIISIDDTSREGYYRYKRDVDRAWTKPVAFDLSGGALDGVADAHEVKVLVNNVKKPTGIFVYFDVSGLTPDTTDIVAGDRFYFNVTYNDGSHFVNGDQESLHQNIECSGRGSCDRSSGRCQCFVGYTGDACERTSCPNDCSGHGVCQSLSRFAADTESSSVTKYTGFDKNMEYGCLCDLGFRGPDCSKIECPSGPDPMGGNGGSDGMDCSGRGVCDYATGTCQCATGFFGERCESITTLV